MSADTDPREESRPFTDADDPDGDAVDGTIELEAAAAWPTWLIALVACVAIVSAAAALVFAPPENIRESGWFLAGGSIACWLLFRGVQARA